MRRTKMYSILKAKNGGMKKEIREFLVNMLEIPSPSKGEDQVAEMVRGKMQGLGFDKVYRDDAGNVIGIIYGLNDSPTVILNSHLDTVSPDDSKWTRHPYKAVHIDNRIHGAGAADCKSGVAAHIYAAELLKRSMLPLKGNIVVAATVTEENGFSVGGRNLLGKTMPKLGLEPDYVILGEPTGNGLYYGHDGRMEIDISIEGNDPFRVDDGARELYRDLSGKIASHDRQTPVDLSCAEPEFSVSEGRRHASIHLEKKLHYGEQPAAVTDWFKHEADLMLKTEKALAVEVRVVENERKLYGGERVMVKRIVNAWETDPYHPLMARARQSLNAAGCIVNTGKWRLDRPGMGTAGGVIRNEFDLPVIGFGPGEENQAHRPDESVDFDKLLDCVYGTASIAHGLAGIPVFGWTSDEI